MSTDTRIRKVALITGASSGMGQDFCFRLIKEGYIVHGAARRSGAMGAIEDVPLEEARRVSRPAG